MSRTKSSRTEREALELKSTLAWTSASTRAFFVMPFSSAQQLGRSGHAQGGEPPSRETTHTPPLEEEGGGGGGGTRPSTPRTTPAEVVGRPTHPKADARATQQRPPTTAGLTGRTTAVTATAGLTEQNDSRDKYRVMTRTRPPQRRGQAHGRTESRTTAVTVLLIRSKHDKGKAHEMHTHEEDVNQ